jgi:DNA (cytosine-5)-methyltransferase 1
MVVSKPPYRVPLMAEIRQIPWNGVKVISLFSGCGGSSLGYRLAGCKVLLANEFIPAAQETYHANFPSTVVDGRDVRLLTPEALLTTVRLKPGELDILDGSPPCASFSMSGKRHKAWGQQKIYSETVQRTDDLFFEYARLLEGLQPRAFVAENVAGLVRGSAKGYFKLILRRLKDCGYQVKAALLDAQWLGVPQARQRLIFIGLRQDLGLEPVFPSPLPYRYTVRDAWQGLQELPTPDIDITRYSIGKLWDEIGPGEQHPRRFNLVKLHPDKPSPTITATAANPGAASVVHPTQKRKLSIPELKRICSFPDDFVLTGNYSQQAERLGRSVPPVMMSQIARAVCEVLRQCQAA